MLKVGYQGVNGTYSEIAVNKFFNNMEFVGVNYTNFKDLINDVANKSIDYALLPVENSTTGIIYRTYDLLKDHNVFAVGEVNIKIQEDLLGIRGAQKKDIKEVYSHPEALIQCQNYLSHNNMKPISYQDTAASVKLVKSCNDVSKGALASSLAAKYYDMEIIEENVQDNKLNTTRFLCISNIEKYDEFANKISMYFVVNHTPGALFEAIKVFADRGINMLRLESRPIQNRIFEYCFYIDFQGNINNTNIINAINEVKNHCVEVKVLGNYVKAKLPSED